MRFVRTVAAAAALALVPLSVASCSSKPTPCEAAFKAAADVAPGQTNDTQMVETLKVCSGREWLKTIEKYPGAIGVDEVTNQDIATAAEVLCAKVPEGQAEYCDDAREAGVLP